jgi:hypothetical protein
MSSYCYICEEDYSPDSFKYIYRIVNTKTNSEQFFKDQPLFAFDYPNLKVELIRVGYNSDDYFRAVDNSLLLSNRLVRIIG